VNVTRKIITIFAVIAVVLPLTAAKGCSTNTGPSTSGNSCRIEEWHAPTKASGPSGAIVYGSVANYCSTGQDKIGKLTVKVWLQREHGSDWYPVTGSTVTVRLAGAAVPSSPEHGVITSRTACIPGYYRVTGSVVVNTTDGRSVTGTMSGAPTVTHIASCHLGS
jgi:hypothetical protein